jgi:hypothetical protein
VYTGLVYLPRGHQKTLALQAFFAVFSHHPSQSCCTAPYRNRETGAASALLHLQNDMRFHALHKGNPNISSTLVQ